MGYNIGNFNLYDMASQAAQCAHDNCEASKQNAQSALTSATSAAVSAAAAAQSAQIAGIYLGPFAVAPTTDNQGGPLQEGMLYYNTVSNVLFAWNGTAWASADFNEFTNFTATGTTTARNLVTRMADVVNVKDFGAIGDGVADDTAAIQAAITYANSLGGAKVFLPEGTYQTSAAIELMPFVWVDGSGSYGTIVRGNGLHPVFSVSGSLVSVRNSGKLTNLSIRGGSKVNVNARGIDLRWANRYGFENIEIFQCYIGVYFDNCWQVKMENIHVHGAGGDQSYIGFYGAEVNPANQNNVVNAQNCIVQGVEKYGFRLINFNGSKFDGCEALDGEVGFYLGNPTVGTEPIRWGNFVNCLADTNSQIGWRLERGSASFFQQCTFSNCWAGNCAKGWSISDVSVINIDAALVVGNPAGGGMVAGIELDRCARITISGGSIYDYSTVGIQLNDSQYINISGNHLYTTAVSPNQALAESGTSDYNIGFCNTFTNGVTVIGANSNINTVTNNNT